MFEGDEYEDQLLGDPNQLDDLIEARDLNPLEDEQNEEEEVEADVPDEEKAEDASDNTKTKRRVTRNPQPKLDAIRLTGPRGIATVEGLFRDFQFLGHGHEEQDLKRIMERLELWGNRLFPKYQFDDLLEKIEKLGQKRPVMNFVSKIRLGIVTEDSVAEGPGDVIEDVDMDLEMDEHKVVGNDDLFNQLLTEEVSQVESPLQTSQPPPPPQMSITEEQRQRMLQNRLLAEERRLAKLKAQQEKDSVPSTVDESCKVEASLPQVGAGDDGGRTVEGASQSDEAERISETSENSKDNVDINDAALVSTVGEGNDVGLSAEEGN